MAQTKECVKRIQPGLCVDRAVIIVDETVSDTNIEWLNSHGCEVHVSQWSDSMPAMRNTYLSFLEYGDWAVVSDPDEWFGDAFCRDLRTIVGSAENSGYGLLLIAAHDNTSMPDGSVQTSVSGFHKNLIFKYCDGVSYIGVCESMNVHEVLVLPEGTQTCTLPEKYFYTHYKTYLDLLERSMRNVFIGGGGDNVGVTNVHWQPLRDLSRKEGIDTWPEMRSYLRKGAISSDLVEWFQSVRDVGGTNYLDETQQCYNYYNAIHPEELAKDG